MKQLSLGYSPCPNDTFIFYAISHGTIDLGGLKFGRPQLEDVETLNAWALAHHLDVTKISCHALGHVSDEYCVLAAAALSAAAVDRWWLPPPAFPWPTLPVDGWPSPAA